MCRVSWEWLLRMLLHVIGGVLLLSSVNARADPPEEPAAYLKVLREILPSSPEWDQWLQQSGELPELGKLGPRAAFLPDPLLLEEGGTQRRVRSEEDWQRRRQQIRQIYERYVTGRWPPKPATIRAVELDRHREESATVAQLRLEFGAERSAGIGVRLMIPDGKGPFPVFLGPAWTDDWARIAVRRGYLCAVYAGSDNWDDAKALKAVYPGYDFTLIARRAWAGARVLDYLETTPVADMTKVALTGHSRDGKQALLLAAFDERIKAVIPSSSGTYGATPFRFVSEKYFSESLERKTRWDPEWFHPRGRFYAGQEHRLPFDQNLLIAMVAPRSCLLSQALNDDNDEPWGVEQAYLSALTAYELLGVPSRLGTRWREQLHGTRARDIEDYLDWFDLQLGRRSATYETELLFGYSFDKWRNLSGERVDASQYPRHKRGLTMVTPGVPTKLEDWAKVRPEIEEKVRWILGEAPPRVRQRNLPSGSTRAIRLSTRAWRKDLYDDLPLFAIRDGGHYGWNAPQRDRVSTQQIGFGDDLIGDVYWPSGAESGGKRLPAVVWLHGFSFSTGAMWAYRPDLNPILALVEQGYVVFAFDMHGFGTRIREAKPFYERYPHWSRLGTMIGDVGSAIDYLERVEIVDSSRIYLFGYSLGGAVALYSAALDQRVAGVVTACGFTPMRSDQVQRGTEGIERYSHLHGLAPRLGFFAGQEDRIPFDFPDLLAMIAPRPLIVMAPQWDRDAHSDDVHAAVGAARAVYKLHQAERRLSLLNPLDYNRVAAASMTDILRLMRAQMP